jgi:hypothetical protein
MGYTPEGQRILSTGAESNSAEGNDVSKSSQQIIKFPLPEPRGFVSYAFFRMRHPNAAWGDYIREMDSLGYPMTCQEMLSEARIWTDSPDRDDEPVNGQFKSRVGSRVRIQSLDSTDFHRDDLYSAWSSRSTGWKSAEASFATFAKDRHKPTHVITGGTAGWEIFAGSESRVEDHAHEYDLVLNFTGYSLTRRSGRHTFPVDALKKYEDSGSQDVKTIARECVIDWHDGGAAPFPASFWVDLISVLKAEKWRALMFCIGGHGRTGTAIACCMVAMGHSADKSIKWVRTNYCKHAIETKTQEEYVYRVEKKLAKSVSPNKGK